MLSAGVSYERGLDATLAYQRTGRYHNAWEFFGMFHNKWEDDPDAGHVENINQCVDNIAAVVNRSYVKLRGYILARMGPFFRRSVYRSRPIIEIGTDALSRWLEASHGKMK